MNYYALSCDRALNNEIVRDYRTQFLPLQQHGCMWQDLSVVQDSRMGSICNSMVVLYGDRIIIKCTPEYYALRCDSALRKKVQDFRVHPILQQHP